MTDKIWTPQEIKDNMQKDTRWLYHGIVAIYRRQTSAEQQVEATTDHNGRGFNGIDAQLLTSFAKQIERGRNLSEKQLFYARKKMMKYATQLALIANGKE